MESIFIKACRTNDKALIDLFLDIGGEDLNLQDDLGNTALHYICMKGDTDLAELTIKAGVRIDLENISGETPLHIAAARGSVIISGYLLDKGADINAVTMEGMTPLIYAICSCQIQTAKFLMSSGADKFALTKKGLTAIDFAKAENLAELFSLLEVKLPKVDVKGNTPLHHAVYQNGLAAIRNILANDKSGINARNNQGLTPLLLAINKLNYGISDLLLQNGADPNVVETGDENTPLHIAAFNGVSWLGEILLEHGAKINALNRDRATPLILAVLGQHREFAALLLRKGAAIENADIHGKTARDYALDWGTDELADLLDSEKSRFASRKKA
ncbi:MAG: ankyrin repeat domain-containing protein [Treponema sp.]|nr:ankyrin repeat domain-containing protein [Treponema sp.]